MATLGFSFAVKKIVGAIAQRSAATAVKAGARGVRQGRALSTFRKAQRFQATQTAIPKAADAAPGLLRRAGQSIRRNPKLSLLSAGFALDQTLKGTTGIGLFDAAGIPLGLEDPRDVARIEALDAKAALESEVGLAQREERLALFGLPEELRDPFDQQFGTFAERAAQNALIAERIVPGLIMSGVDISALLASTGPNQGGAIAGLSAGEQARLAQASRTTGPQTPTKAPQAIDPALAGAQALASI